MDNLKEKLDQIDNDFIQATNQFIRTGKTYLNTYFPFASEDQEEAHKQILKMVKQYRNQYLTPKIPNHE